MKIHFRRVITGSSEITRLVVVYLPDLRSVSGHRSCLRLWISLFLDFAVYREEGLRMSVIFCFVKFCGNGIERPRC